MRGTGPVLAAAATMLAALNGCGARSSSTTGLYVTVEISAVTVDQVELTVTGETPEAIVVPPTARPLAPGVALPSPQTVSVYLPDALAGTTVTCLVAGLAGGNRVDARAAATAAVRQGALVAVNLVLAPATGKPNGATCAPGDTCASGFCVEGICCTSPCDGVCQTCNVPGSEGTCAPAAAGTRTSRCAEQGEASCGFDGTCDGSGGCRRYPLGVACAPASCAAGQLVPASACDGQGGCVPAPEIDCAPYACDAAAASPARCRAACATDADCVAGKTCIDGSCGTRTARPNGQGCQDAADCESGHCADGVCCDGACDGRCVSCNQTEALGACRPVTAGRPDPHGVCTDGGVARCGQNGLCDGQGACALYPAGAACATGNCVARFVLGARRCDGRGACAPASLIDCAPYTCDARAGACFASCTSAAQCAPGSGSCTMNMCR